MSLVLDAVLRPLAAGRDAFIPRYDWHAAAWGELVDPRAACVSEIVEGTGAGARGMPYYLTLYFGLEGEAAKSARLTMNSLFDFIDPQMGSGRGR